MVMTMAVILRVGLISVIALMTARSSAQEMSMEELKASLDGIPPNGHWDASMDDSIAQVSPIPKCKSTPPIPPREDIQQFNASFMKEIQEALVNNTLGPCTSGPHNPSSTALSGAFILGGKVNYFNYGCVSKRQPKKAPTEKSIYRLASNSKTFAVETVIQAFRDGKIDSFDDELRKYFDDFYIPNPFGSSQPTFRQMMSQLAGIPRTLPCKPGCNLTTSEMLPRIKQYNKLMMKPWSYPSYSNAAYSILGHLIAERMYGKPWSEFLVENIVSPLHMDSTGVNYTSGVRSRMVSNYLLNGSEAPFEPLGWMDPAGGVYSTSEDMATWILHYLNEWKEETPRGQLRRNTMMQVYENPEGYSGFGMPFEIFSSNGYLVRTKAGNLAGLTSFTAMISELDFGVVLLWNGAGVDTIAVGRTLANTVVPVLRKQYMEYRTHNFPKLSSDFVEEYLGIYQGLPGTYVAVNATKDPSLQDSLIAYISFGAAGTVPLKPESSTSNGFEFRVFFRRKLDTCVMAELQANLGEWVYFNTLKDGTKQFSFPGIQFLNYTKVN